MKIYIITICMIIPVWGLTQTVLTEYYADKWLTKPVKKKNAEFIKSTYTEADGTTCMDITAASGEILRLEMYKGKEPVGKWIMPWGQGLQYFDYDFEMVYQKECNPGSDTLFVLPMGLLPLQDHEEIGYQAPVPSLLPHQLIRKMVTPPTAKQDSAKGKVIVGFRIEKDGAITDFHVVQGVHPALDKEALRLIKQLTFISPAMVKNKPVSVCTTQPFNFRLIN